MAQRTIRERGKVSATRKDNLASSHNYSNAMLGTLPLGKSLGCWIAENLSRRQNCSSIALMHSGPFSRLRKNDVATKNAVPVSCFVWLREEFWLRPLQSLRSLFHRGRHRSALVQVACIARFRRRTKL